MNNRKVYVAAMHKQLRGKLDSYSRLYAFPNEPEMPPPDGFIILDSGAFGLSQQGKKMDAHHMAKLNAHYLRHNAGNTHPIVGIAPDVYSYPRSTMKNWSYWHEQGYPSVAPVIQFENGRVDLYSVTKQCEFYQQWPTPFVCVSNPGMRALAAIGAALPQAIAIVRQNMKPDWVHVLGAGWDKNDIRHWGRMAVVDSIDSIAYYTAAQERTAWSELGPHWTKTAVNNLEIANQCINH